jgi:hypothetical protein
VRPPFSLPPLLQTISSLLAFPFDCLSSPTPWGLGSLHPPPHLSLVCHWLSGSLPNSMKLMTAYGCGLGWFSVGPHNPTPVPSPIVLSLPCPAGNIAFSERYGSALPLLQARLYAEQVRGTCVAHLLSFLLHPCSPQQHTVLIRANLGAQTFPVVSCMRLLPHA